MAILLSKPAAFCALLGALAKPVRELQVKGYDGLKGKTLVVGALSEFSAAFMLVFFALGIQLSVSSASAAAIGFGATVLVLTTVFGPISGAHLNPAVSFGLFAAGKSDGKKTASYIAAQCLGAFLGALVLKYCLGVSTLGGFNALPQFGGIGVWSAFTMEALGAALLVSTVLASGQALPVGAAVALAHLLLFSATGCGINPARSLGPALVNGSQEALKNLWIFVAAPMLGGWAAGTKACWFKK